MKKFILTDVSKEVFGVKLFQIKALISFGSVSKNELGGWVEKEENISQTGNAWVYGDAWVCAKSSFTKGWFIGGDDSGKIAEIAGKTGSTYWKKQYVLGDYEITPIEEEKMPTLKGKEVEVKLDGVTYKAIIQ